MSLHERTDDADPLKFLLQSEDPRRPSVAFVCQGANEQERAQWVAQIRHLLAAQRDFLKAIQSPIAYQKEQTKYV